MPEAENTTMVIHVHVTLDELERLALGEVSAPTPTEPPADERIDRAAAVDGIEAAVRVAQETGAPVCIDVCTDSKGWHTRTVRVVSIFDTGNGAMIGALDLGLIAEGTPENEAYRTFKVAKIDDIWSASA